MLVIKVIDPCRSEVCVIHYASPGAVMAGKLGKNNQIFEENKVITELIERAVYKDGVIVLDAQEGIKRARSRRNENEYKLFSNNCESFANWALTGEDVTDQGKAAPVKIGMGAALGVGVAAIAVGGLIAMFSDSKKNDKEKE